MKDIAVVQLNQDKTSEFVVNTLVRYGKQTLLMQCCNVFIIKR